MISVKYIAEKEKLIKEINFFLFLSKISYIIFNINNKEWIIYILKQIYLEKKYFKS